MSLYESPSLGYQGRERKSTTPTVANPDPELTNGLSTLCAGAVAVIAVFVAAWIIPITTLQVAQPNVWWMAALVALGYISTLSFVDRALWRRNALAHVGQLAVQTLVIGICAGLIIFLSPYQDDPTRFLAIWFVIALAGAIAADYLSANTGAPEHVAVYGDAGELEAASNYCRETGAAEVSGIFERNPSVGQPDLALEELVTFARSEQCNAIVLANSAGQEASLHTTLSRLAVLPTEVRLFWRPSTPTNTPKEKGSSKANLASGMIVVQHAPIGPKGRLAKAILDRTIAVLALPFLAPVLLAIAIAIKLDSPGPILFSQQRGGRNKKPFRIYKFRTMTVQEDGQRVQQVQREDSRVTQVGRFLRRTSLDELPQLFNVLKGDLSLVGPRPHALAHDEEYGNLIPSYDLRMRMKPGITGWAQINGCRGNTSQLLKMARRVEHDNYYINNWSIAFDVWILLNTIPLMFKDEEAY